jgi:hypothetical protein
VSLLWWPHHAFLTDLPGDPVEIDAFHRAHAVVELPVRDANEGWGVAHMRFAANGAWLACELLATTSCARPLSSAGWWAPKS